ncbi:MAG: hypothetical protein R3E91_05575 [Chlamydiales bacterium]
MRRFILFILFVFISHLEASYTFDETFLIPFEEKNIWKKVKESADDNGSSISHFIGEEENGANWPELLTIQFKDSHLIEGSTAEEAMISEQKKSPLVKWQIIRNDPNDVIYERFFPKGEHELVRMIMTKKGLHRAAYLKQKAFNENEKTAHIHCLIKGTIHH